MPSWARTCDSNPSPPSQGDVVVGEGTWIGPNAVLMDGARIGRNCRIFPGAVISAPFRRT
jgi:UDP-N-acetylglucosamine acyltransferase